MTTEPAVEYALGHSAAELQRLRAQANLLDPFTGRLFRDAGLRPGMRVLDVGCGNGDVTVLASEAVGPHGQVVALDRASEAIEATRRRTASMSHVEVVAGDLTHVAFETPFDAVVGRLVLMYCQDPAATLEHLANQLRPGGLMIFQEYDLQVFRSRPPAPLYDEILRLIVETLRQVGTETDMGLGLHTAYLAAGMPAPSLRYEAALGGGPDYSAYEVVAQVAASILPVVERLGLADPTELEIETLAERMRDEVVTTGGVISLPPLVGAHAVKGG